MPRLRPQQTMLSGLGVAGSVLAAVVVTFALASGIIAYTLTSDDPLARASGTLVLGPQRTAELARSPLVLHKARAVRTRRRLAVGAATTLGSARGRVSGSVSTGSVGRAVDPGRPGGGAIAKGSDQTGPAVGTIVRTPVGKALDSTSQAVTATTGPLARRLHVSDELAARAEPIVVNTHGTLVRLLRLPPR